MTPIIEFKDYTFKYRSQVEPTLRDINLNIYPGDCGTIRVGKIDDCSLHEWLGSLFICR